MATAVVRCCVTHTRTLKTTAVALLLVALVGCGSSSKATTSATTSATFAPVTTAAAAATTAAPASGGFSDQQAIKTSTAAATTIAPNPGGAPPPAGVERKIATVSTVDIQVKEVGDATVKITAFIEGAGGYVSAQQTSLGDNPTSTISAKIPPSQLSGLLNSIGGVGKVVARGQQADDVTAQYVDLEGRIASQRISVDRMRELYAKASTVEELAKAEGELARRESELESMLGQKRVLDGRVDLATITISIHPEPVTTATTVAGKSISKVKPGDAFGKSMKAMGRFFAALLVIFVVLAPWLLVAALVLAPLVWIVRRQARSRAARMERILIEARRPLGAPQTATQTEPAPVVEEEPVSVGS
jgi:Domain of unknown function (DUF4349)